MKVFKRIADFFSSFGLSVVLLLLLLVLTFLGTLYQVDNGLYAAQEKYFNSIFVVHHLFGVVPVPMPGVYLVSILLFINLVVGGIIRIKKNWKEPGVLIAHIGIIVLLLGGLVTFKVSDSGNMQLYEGETSNEFISYYDWIIEIGNPNKTDEVFVIDDSLFTDLKFGEERTFHNDAWPFDVVLSGYGENTWPQRVNKGTSPGIHSVDGVYLETLEASDEGEQNVPGAYVSIKDKESGETTEGILWGITMQPFVVSAAGSDWTFDMSRKRWEVPFVVTLDEFKRELHPGTQMASSYESYITKSEGTSNEKIRVWMNHPLRYKGYTFFQASWGPQGAGPNTRLYSVFSVVRNPADQIPLVSCIIISFGLLLHFIQRLGRYLKAESKRRTA